MACSISRGAVSKQNKHMQLQTTPTPCRTRFKEQKILQENTTSNLEVPNYFTTRRQCKKMSKENVPSDLEASPNISAIKAPVHPKTFDSEPSDIETQLTASFNMHFTSTPRNTRSQINLSPSSPLVLPTPSKNMFITKRSTENKKFQALTNPVVVLERLSNVPQKKSSTKANARTSKQKSRPTSEEYNEVIVKEGTTPKRKRSAAVMVKSYAEPSLNKKLRRD